MSTERFLLISQFLHFTDDIATGKPNDKLKNSGQYDVQSCLLGYTAINIDWRPPFLWCVLPPKAGLKISPGIIPPTTTLNIILTAERT
jgi:hypothetical protein